MSVSDVVQIDVRMHCRTKVKSAFVPEFSPHDTYVPFKCVVI